MYVNDYIYKHQVVWFLPCETFVQYSLQSDLELIWSVVIQLWWELDILFEIIAFLEGMLLNCSNLCVCVCVWVCVCVRMRVFVCVRACVWQMAFAFVEDKTKLKRERKK